MAILYMYKYNGENFYLNKSIPIFYLSSSNDEALEYTRGKLVRLLNLVFTNLLFSLQKPYLE